jgi:DeoR/GlpR family transcriptional regulator of sugar metabolism
MGSVEGPTGFNARTRREEIARLVEEDERVSVGELTDRFHVTDASIRRDLVILEDAGRLRRVHGGAVARLDPRSRSVYSAKQRENREQKARIGAAAAALIGAGDVVFFDSGTTVVQVAAHVPPALRRASAITVVTHSLAVIDEVGDWESPHLICPGGLYLPDYRAMVGPQTVAGLRDLSADIVFLGCDGLSTEAGLTTPHMLVAEVGAAMSARSRRVIAVADSSKLGRQGFTPIVPLAAVDVLITDDAADAGEVERVRRLGIEVILA